MTGQNLPMERNSWRRSHIRQVRGHKPGQRGQRYTVEKVRLRWESSFFFLWRGIKKQKIYVWWSRAVDRLRCEGSFDTNVERLFGGYHICKQREKPIKNRSYFLLEPWFTSEKSQRFKNVLNGQEKTSIKIDQISISDHVSTRIIFLKVCTENWSFSTPTKPALIESNAWSIGIRRSRKEGKTQNKHTWRWNRDLVIYAAILINFDNNKDGEEEGNP